jgi:hypothetical protein
MFSVEEAHGKGHGQLPSRYSRERREKVACWWEEERGSRRDIYTPRGVLEGTNIMIDQKHVLFGMEKRA